jgi:hypothetical protein
MTAFANAAGFSSGIQCAVSGIRSPETFSATSRIMSSSSGPELLIVPHVARTGIVSFPLR